MTNDMLDILVRLFTYFMPFLFALCFHEYAHGWVARLRGDNTALMMGRLTMNPLVHMDILGTVILPMIAILNPGMGFFFGWAKPVPVNERNLKNPRIDMFWIALAGPLSNIFLSIISALALFVLARTLATTIYFRAVAEFFSMFISINLFLAIFNLLPLHPLDGGKVLARFLPPRINYKLEQAEQISSLILMGLIIVGATKFLVIPVRFFHSLLINFALG